MCKPLSKNNPIRITSINSLANFARLFLNMVVRDVIHRSIKKNQQTCHISDSEENENVLTGCYENEPQYTEFERTYENKFKAMKHFNNK